MSDFGTPPSCGGRLQNKEDLQMPETLQVVFMEIWLYDTNHSAFFKAISKTIAGYKQPEFQAEPGKQFTVKNVCGDSPSFSWLLFFKGGFCMCLSFATL